MSKFELQISNDGRAWTVKAGFPDEQAAMRQAQALSRNASLKGVRVVSTAFGRDKVVWEYENKKEPPLTASSVEAAPACASIDDFYKFGARRAGARILRKFLDRHAVTALELLYSQSHLKMANRTDPLFTQAVGVAAKVTASAADTPMQKRIEFYYKVFDKILLMARDAEDDATPFKILKQNGADALVARMRADREGPQIAFAIRSGLARLLNEEGDYSKKLALLIDLIDAGATETSTPYIDEAIAEIIDSAGALRELLGGQPDLARALGTMVDLVGGKLARATDVLGRLNGAFAQADLPLAREVLIDRIRGQFGGVNKLTREGGAAENDAFKKLLSRMATKTGLIGGPAVAEAAARRGAAVFSPDEADQRVEFGIEGVIGLFPDAQGRIGFLTDLATTATGEKYDFAIVRGLSELIMKPTDAQSFAIGARNAEAAIAQLRVARDLVETSEGVPAEWRPRFIEKIDTLIADPEGRAAAPAPAVGAPAMSDKPLGQRSFAAGDFLFQEGDPGDEAYLIKVGSVEISRRQGNRETSLATVGRGAIIGEMALIDDQPRMASAKAVEAVEATVIPKDGFKQRLARLQTIDPVMKRLLEVFVERIRVQTRRS
ncbi:MAG: cyclic nucleotide-binding domain-containing protein [Pseudomonadota bacterium]